MTQFIRMPQQQIIDTGLAPEIYIDNLGYIQVIGDNVFWHGIRYRNQAGLAGPPYDRMLALTAITPISAVPNIAEQIATTFKRVLVDHRIRDRLLGITD